MILIKNAHLVDSEGIRTGSLGIDDQGTITDEKDSSDHVIDAKGMIVTPAFANTHTHVAMSLFRNYADDMKLYEWLSQKIWPLEKKLDPKTAGLAAEVSCIEMARSGTGLFNDMYFHCKGIAEGTERIGLRAVIGYGMADRGDPAEVKKELEIAEQTRKELKNKLTGFAYCPHAIYTCSDELITKAHGLAKKHGAIFHMHAAETRKEVFDCLKKNRKKVIEHLDSLGVLDSSTVLAHSSFVSLRELGIIAKSGASVSHCPVSNMKLANGDLCPVADMLEKKVNVTLGTDGPASNNSQNIVETAKLAAIAQKNHRWDAEITNSKETFRMLTANGYSALGFRGGLLTKGFLGDLTIINWKKANMLPFTDPYSMIIYSMNPSNTDGLIINGKPVMLDSKILTVDEEKTLEQFRKAAEGFLN